jgi:hypothetical protein
VDVNRGLREATGRNSIALSISRVFNDGDLDFARRPGAPVPGWDAMPECVAAAAVRGRGGTDVDVRLVTTFTAAMDRARDADRLWAAAVRLHETSPWVFDRNVCLAPHWSIWLTRCGRHA